MNVRILRNWYDGGELVFRAGEKYPADAAALRQVELGNAEVIDAEQPARAESAAEAQPEQPVDPAPEQPTAGRRKKQA
jgi:hypothetical protein